MSPTIEHDIVPAYGVPTVALLVDPYEILLYADGTARFAHVCDRGDRGVIRCAPLLDAAHQVTDWLGRPTITPSILCLDCGTHGWVTQGVWSPA